MTTAGLAQIWRGATGSDPVVKPGARETYIQAGGHPQGLVPLLPAEPALLKALPGWRSVACFGHITSTTSRQYRARIDLWLENSRKCVCLSGHF